MEVYKKFLNDLDARLEDYSIKHAEHLCCKKGCSHCCEKGDYPISELELRYLMQGYINLESDKKLQVQDNISRLQKGGQCPFLIKHECAIYPYRPIICRVHGLAYICKENTVKVPYCANNGLNYSKVYESKTFSAEPILENLDTQNVLKNFDFGEIRNLCDWLNGID